jgi:sirohydrochlorin cobaltochelatase
MIEKLGILVVGHGTTSPVGTAEFVSVVEKIGPLFRAIPVGYGFLEHSHPLIDEGVEVLAGEGVTSLVVAPLLLFSAGHAKSDIPREVEKSATKRGIAVRGQAEVLGLHGRIIELTLRRFNEASETLSPKPAFVLIGRGNLDPDAQAVARQFVAACRQAGDLAIAELGYLALAEPPIETVLQQLGAAKTPQCVIVPHLLFHGELIARCDQLLASIASQFPQTDWRLASRLGPNEMVIEAASDRIRAAIEVEISG